MVKINLLWFYHVYNISVIFIYILMQRFTFFWRTDSPFSNWHPSTFRIGFNTFNCMEQYMMYSKSMLFQDFKTAEKILAEPEPRKQKELGREVQGFNPDIWDLRKEGIVLIGLREKFYQNPHLLAALMETRGTILVEASPLDKIWGAGLDEEGCRNTPPGDWIGLNLLGLLLTQLRNELDEE